MMTLEQTLIVDLRLEAAFKEWLIQQAVIPTAERLWKLNNLMVEIILESAP